MSPMSYMSAWKHQSSFILIYLTTAPGAKRPMPGTIKLMIDTITATRSKGNPTIAVTTRTKFILKGVNPDRFNATSPDDPAVIAKVRAIGAEMGVTV